MPKLSIRVFTRDELKALKRMAMRGRGPFDVQAIEEELKRRLSLEKETNRYRWLEHLRQGGLIQID